MAKTKISPKLIRDFMEISHRLTRQRLTFGIGGGISMVVPDSDRVLIKGWEIASEDLRAKDISLIDFKGNQLNRTKPCLETPLHLAVLQVRKDIGAVIHAHSPYATAFGNLKPQLKEEILNNYSFLRMGVFTPFADPGSQELAETAARPFQDEKVYWVFMQDHGITVVGSDIYSAYYRLDFLEGMAKSLILTMLLRPSRSVVR